MVYMVIKKTESTDLIQKAGKEIDNTPTSNIEQQMEAFFNVLKNKSGLDQAEIYRILNLDFNSSDKEGKDGKDI